MPNAISFPKLVSHEELASVGRDLSATGRTLVLTNGCFDLLHLGHVRYLQAARAFGDALAVAVNGDDSVRILKGPRRPIHSEMERAEVLAALGCVDYVTIFHTPRLTGLIQMVAPGAYAKGGDYTLETLNGEERAALEAANTKIYFVPFVSGKSTTSLLRKMEVSQ